MGIHRTNSESHKQRYLLSFFSSLSCHLRIIFISSKQKSSALPRREGFFPVTKATIKLPFSAIDQFHRLVHLPWDQICSTLFRIFLKMNKLCTGPEGQTMLKERHTNAQRETTYRKVRSRNPLGHRVQWSPRVYQDSITFLNTSIPQCCKQSLQADSDIPNTSYSNNMHLYQDL